MGGGGGTERQSDPLLRLGRTASLPTASWATFADGYLDSGVLNGNQSLYYGNSRSVDLTGSTTAHFNGGWVSFGRLNGNQTLSYGSGLTANFLGSTDGQFDGEYLYAGMLNGNQSEVHYPGYNVTLKASTLAIFYPAGRVWRGTLSGAQSLPYNNYGGDLMAGFKDNTLIQFFGAYVSHGTLNSTQELDYFADRHVWLKTGTEVWFGEDAWVHDGTSSTTQTLITSTGTAEVYVNDPVYFYEGYYYP